MEAKERAKNLLDKFIHIVGSECEHACYCEDRACQYQGMVICKVDQQKAKQRALICIEEQMNNAGFIWGGHNSETGLSARDEYRKYWNEVKSELEKL